MHGVELVIDAPSQDQYLTPSYSGRLWLSVFQWLPHEMLGGFRSQWNLPMQDGFEVW